MTDHLPECKALDTMPTGTRLFYSTSRKWFWEHGCICDRLRACEQRVREEIDREAFVLDDGDPFRQAYRKGLDAAREAVKVTIPHADGCRGLCPCCMGDYDCTCQRRNALAAIDALRGES